jgi:pimeloyl-ACP methyl ester carboxylesterase
VLSIGLQATEYSIGDFIRFSRRAKLSNQLLWNELMSVNLARDVREVSVPVVFFAGRHDFTTPSEFVEAYFIALKAPSKKFVWFENSAHMPNIEEPHKFQREVIKMGRMLLQSTGQPIAVDQHVCSQGGGKRIPCG